MPQHVVKTWAAVDAADEIEPLLPGEATAKEARPRLPFREYALSTGLTVYVGRDGSDNDRTKHQRPLEHELHEVETYDRVREQESE